MTLFRFVQNSANKKTGPIAVTSSQSATCPTNCPLNDNGTAKCYGGFGNSAIHWRKLDNATEEKGNIVNADELFHRIKRIPAGSLWRHNEVGDLPHDNQNIEPGFVDSLIKANRGKRGFTYTHHALTDNNLNIIRKANAKGFTINLSANSVKQAVQYVKAYGLPTVTLLPTTAPNMQRIDGIKVVACPAETKPVTCATCGICAKSERDYVIGFRAHGTNKKKTEQIAQGEIVRLDDIAKEVA